MRISSLAGAALTLLLVCIGTPPSARAEACDPPGTPPNVAATTEYFDGNELLGPKDLPTGPVARLLTGYQRLGGLSAPEFLFRYQNTEPKQVGNDSVWRWPPGAAGFNPKAGPPFGAPDDFKFRLDAGRKVDRFGRPSNGFYLAPAGMAFSERALPPSSLKTWATNPEGTEGPEAGYHVYCVAKPFDVDSGPIFSWFQQTGSGTQYWLKPDYMPENPITVDVAWLIEHGYLVEQRPT